MTERPKWMPSREGLLPMCHNESLYDNCKYDYAGDEVEESHYRTGLRAQIAVLERLASMSVPMIHPDDPTRYIVSGVQKAAILDEIAALRKELASE